MEQQASVRREGKGVWARASRALTHLTVQQYHGLLERQRVPDLHLAVGTLQDSLREEEHKGCRLLDALEHAVLGQVVGTVVVLRTEEQADKRMSRRARGEESESVGW